MSKRRRTNVIRAILTILTNYAAIGLGIGVFEHNTVAMISGWASVIGAIYVACLLED